MPKYKQNVSLVISKLMSPFSLLPYSLVQPSTLSTNISKNYSKNVRGVPISSSLLNCGMFSCSTILISRFFHFISKRSRVRSWSFSSVDGFFSTAARLLTLSWALSYRMTAFVHPWLSYLKQNNGNNNDDKKDKWIYKKSS